MQTTIGYTRVSTRGQSERGEGLPAQETRLRRFAKEHGYELVDVVSEAVSAAVREGELSSLEHRSALSALLERAQRGEYAVSWWRASTG
jgi:DNA invertase Pin-like site-specific DNA recombinase